jgi:hypothetical protein
VPSQVRNGQGVLHTIYTSNVRNYFMEAGGVQSMAKLLNDENVSSIMRYDASVGSWRMYNPATGI